MKRFATLFASALLACVLAGCDGGGISEGSNKEEGPATGIPDAMRQQMEKQGAKMKMQGTGRPKDIPKAKPTDETAPKEPAK